MGIVQSNADSASHGMGSPQRRGVVPPLVGDDGRSRRFEMVGPMEAGSADGQILINTPVGIDVHYQGVDYTIDSEILMPPLDIVIYFARSSASMEPHVADEVREFLQEALDFFGIRADWA